MSQPPGGGQESNAAYAQPQDPWGAFEPGLASVPTDPIPQPPDVYGQGDVWSSPTVPHGAPVGPPQFPAPPPRKRNNAALIVVLVLVVVVVGGAGAYGAYHYVSTRTTATTGGGSPSTSPSADPVPTGFPYNAKVGDCVINVGTTAKPLLNLSSCSAPGSFTIVKIARGASIPVGPKDTFDSDTTSAQVCAGITFDTWFGYQVDDPRLNLFFCMDNNH
jgi:hypothetical protein